MKARTLNKTAAGFGAVLLLVLAGLLLAAVPAAAHSPQGAGEAPAVEIGPILIYDEAGNLNEITLEEIGEMEGNLCICVSNSYRVIQAAFDALYEEDEIPVRGDIVATYHHPGKGHKAAFGYILGPENATYQKTGNPQKMTMEHWVYTFSRRDTGEIFQTQVREGVIDDKFFSLRYKVNGFQNEWHDNEPGAEEKAAFVAAWTVTRDNFLTMPAWELYSGVEEPEEPAPVGAIIFSGALVILVIIGFIYSARGKRR